MCTAVTYTAHNHYFGRTLDLEYSYQESVTITPRNFPLSFRYLPKQKCHYAMIGMAYVQDDYPLYYDAVNEKGLGMAGLNFPGYAYYAPKPAEGFQNLAPFELIPWILGGCETVAEAKTALLPIRLVKEHFRSDLPVTPLHWMIADKHSSIVVEPMEEGLRVYENPAGVLTNNPPFPVQMLWLSHFMGISPSLPENRFAKEISLEPYSRGMGAMGLPGDVSSASRFVRAAFVRGNAISGSSEAEGVGQFFHILGAVEQQRGCVRLEKGQYEITQYTSCCNLDKGIYYYTTYGNRRISAVELWRENPDGTHLVSYPLAGAEDIWFQNGESS